LAESARIRAWVAPLLEHDATLQALTPTIGDRIYNGVAPDDAEYPFLVMQLLSGGNDLFGVGAIRIWSDQLWLFKVIHKGGPKRVSSGPIEPIVNRIDALLHAASGTVTNGVIWECVRERPFELPTFEKGVNYLQLGGEYRIKASNV
jgi:hypothetical protein